MTRKISPHVRESLAKRQMILDYITKSGQATNAQLCDLTGLSKNSARKHASILRDEGRIQIVKCPYRCLTGSMLPDVFVRPGFAPTFPEAPERTNEPPRASDFHGVRVVPVGPIGARRDPLVAALFGELGRGAA